MFVAFTFPQNIDFLFLFRFSQDGAAVVESTVGGVNQITRDHCAFLVHDNIFFIWEHFCGYFVGIHLFLLF